MRARQQGVALLVVLLILALMVTIAATIAERNGRTYLRTTAQLDHQQAKWYGRAAEALASKILQMDTLDSPENVARRKIPDCFAGNSGLILARKSEDFGQSRIDCKVSVASTTPSV